MIIPGRIDVINCARCLGDHKSLEVKPIPRPWHEDDSHFAMCPTTEAPILVIIQDTEEVQS